MSEISSHREYANKDELLTEYKNYMQDARNVELGASYLLNSLIDETILGIVFEIHHEYKTGASAAMEGQPEDPKQFSIADMPDADVFGAGNAKKAMDCTCPNCDRLVAASRFAPHLEKCMGMGRNSLRIASRRIANTREGNNYFTTVLSDDEEDADWSSEKRRKKFQAIRTNGTKKNGKTS